MPDLPRLLRTERSRLADLLASLDDDQWEHSTLCDSWSVRETVAHLTAAASTATPSWMLNMLSTRFDTDRHNDRLMRRHLEPAPAAALSSFRATMFSTTAPFGALDAALGEVVVHGQDIARPLGLRLARKDFAVNSATLVKGMQLLPTDLDVVLGDGPVVRGASIDLVLAMAGRPSAADGLDGEGARILRERLGTSA